jgi:hypothetical protein
MEGKDNFTNLFWAETDMVLIVTVENDPTQGYVAYALSCKYDLGSFRPTAGLVNLNLAEMLPVYGSEINPKFNTMQQTTVEHEITHALGFSPDLFEYY